MNHSVSEETVPGRLIAVEGLDGSGKSTQIALLRRWFELEFHRVYFTEWNSSELVKQATRRAKRKRLLSPTTFSLIHSTDFADRYERQILPLLRGGYLVLADRYIYTAFARDIVRGCDREWVQALYSFARIPDLTFFFDVPLETALDRILRARPVLKYHEAGMDLNLSNDPYESFRLFQGKIYEGYQKQRAAGLFIVIDATLPPERQQELVRRHVRQHIDLNEFKSRFPLLPNLSQRR